MMKALLLLHLGKLFALPNKKGIPFVLFLSQQDGVIKWPFGFSHLLLIFHFDKE